MYRKSINRWMFPGTVHRSELFGQWMCFHGYVYLLIIVVTIPIWLFSTSFATPSGILTDISLFVWAYIFSRFMSVGGIKNDR